MNRTLRTLLVSALALGAALPARSEGLAGAYLAARHASFYSDYDAAARYYTMALARDPANPALLENSVTAFLGLGAFDKAVPVARKMRADGLNSQVADMVLVASAFQDEDYGAVFAGFEGGMSIGPLVDGLVRAWAHVGAGRVSEALEIFDEVAEARGTRAFGLYHKALALGLVGDYEGADRILSGEAEGPLPATRGGIVAHAQILSQLERNGDAVELIDSVFGQNADPAIVGLRDRLAAGETLPFTLVNSAGDGLAEAFYNVANVLEQEASPSYTLLYARVAQVLRPDHVEALLLSASLLEELERFQLATDVYESVPAEHPSFYVAEMGRADALEASGKPDAAIEVLRQLAKSHAGLPMVQNALGDMLRRHERFKEAKAAYDAAIGLYEEAEASQWASYYARGISYERIGQWGSAEADFRKALELSPDQPYVLNYLGYSLVERREKLEEALSMIEAAVAARPEDGYITDSLGWVLYRLGRYEEAVTQMERAAELVPVDPVICDHLGDTLWAVGRKREAEFQWQRALSFDPEAEDAERIRRKLEIGLDRVLTEEGAEPLDVADGG